MLQTTRVPSSYIPCEMSVLTTYNVSTFKQGRSPASASQRRLSIVCFSRTGRQYRSYSRQQGRGFIDHVQVRDVLREESSPKWVYPITFVSYSSILGAGRIRKGASGLFDSSLNKYPNMIQKQFDICCFPKNDFPSGQTWTQHGDLNV